MLTGKRPYLTDDPIALVNKHVYDPVPPLPAEHARYQEIIDCLLVKSPAYRFSDAAKQRDYLADLAP